MSEGAAVAATPDAGAANGAVTQAVTGIAWAYFSTWRQERMKVAGGGVFVWCELTLAQELAPVE